MKHPNTKSKTKGIIYYTSNDLPDPLFSTVQDYILQAELPITSVSLKPMALGFNIVLEEEPSYSTMVKQILTALENAKEDYVFFCEHDVLYHKTHFDFIPPRDDIYYYNANNWRWRPPDLHVVNYDRLISLSGLCVNRELALKHYRIRLDALEQAGLIDVKGEPEWVRKRGYEPGTKKKKRGGLTDEDFEIWKSEYPNIDIRHSGTFSPPKITKDSFKHPPINWNELPIKYVQGWDLKNIKL